MTPSTATGDALSPHGQALAFFAGPGLRTLLFLSGRRAHVVDLHNALRSPIGGTSRCDYTHSPGGWDVFSGLQLHHGAGLRIGAREHGQGGR